MSEIVNYLDHLHSPKSEVDYFQAEGDVRDRQKNRLRQFAHVGVLYENHSRQSEREVEHQANDHKPVDDPRRAELFILLVPDTTEPEGTKVQRQHVHLAACFPLEHVSFVN